MSNNALAAAAAAKREEMLRKKESWFAQRLAAQEREKLVEEQESQIHSVTRNQPEDEDAMPKSNHVVQSEPLISGGARQSAASLNSLLPSDDQVLDRITERITNRLREEVRSEILRDVQEESRKKGNQFQKLEGFLSAELEQATCPICFELMVPPGHTPILIFPCGHTFCNTCLAAHCKANRANCPYCRKPIQSQAPNVMMQQLIEGFANKKAMEKQTHPHPQAPTPAPRAPLPSALESCEGEARDEVERYVREWRSVSMRWRIYHNEVGDCKREIEELNSRREAARLVRGHLAVEMEAAQRRLREAQAEVELIQAQLEQQKERDAQAEAEAADKARRQRLLAGTIEGLDAERARIRLLVRHYLPPSADVDAVLDGAI